MKIFVKLYAPFLEFLPATNNSGMVTLKMRSGVSACDVLLKLGIPPNYPKLIRVNGKLVQEDFILKEENVLELIPPLAGG
jgi:sulfur carrier protein ThiS